MSVGQSTSPSVLLVGCGQMGGALARGWIQNDVCRLSILSSHAPADDIQSRCVSHFASLSEIKKSFDIIVLAIKPQILDELCRGLKMSVKTESLLLSVAAGTQISALEHHFSPAQPIMRVMPNLPSSIGEGVSVCVGNQFCSDLHKNMTDMLMRSVGTVEWIEKEAHMNAVTALSGSGPAYLFLLVEAMAHAGVECGLSSDLALRLARQTVIGSAELLDSTPDISAIQYREAVTSQGGTTEAALKILMGEGALFALFSKAVREAQKRGEELETSHGLLV